MALQDEQQMWGPTSDSLCLVTVSALYLIDYLDLVIGQLYWLLLPLIEKKPLEQQEEFMMQTLKEPNMALPGGCWKSKEARQGFLVELKAAAPKLCPHLYRIFLSICSWYVQTNYIVIILILSAHSAK